MNEPLVTYDAHTNELSIFWGESPACETSYADGLVVCSTGWQGNLTGIRMSKATRTLGPIAVELQNSQVQLDAAWVELRPDEAPWGFNVSYISEFDVFQVHWNAPGDEEEIDFDLPSEQWPIPECHCSEPARDLTVFTNGSGYTVGLSVDNAREVLGSAFAEVRVGAE